MQRTDTTMLFGAEPTAAELIGAEHEQLEAGILEVQAALRGRGRESAAAALTRLASELERQMRMEEDILFRELERLDGSREERPTLQLWQDHGELRALLAKARALLGNESASLGDCFSAVEALRLRLAEHGTKESTCIQGLADRLESPHAVERLLQRVQLCLVPMNFLQFS